MITLNCINYNNYKKYNPTFKKDKDYVKVDKNNNPSVHILGLLTAGAACATGVYLVKKHLPDKTLKSLAKSLSNELNKEIKISDLKSVMTKKEFLRTIKSLKKENYVSSPENIKNGTFIADLHSHSVYSDAETSVTEILNQAVEYGNKLNKINGKKFIFALSDHDGVGGIREALQLIASNPEKYKNIKFVPAAELSMPIYCEPNSAAYAKHKNSVEMAELLIYCINPFSENTKKFFSHLYKLREEGVENSLKIASKNFPDVNFIKEEYTKYFNREKTPYCMLNQHWRIFHYINIKARLHGIAKKINRNPEELYKEVMDSIVRHASASGDDLNKYLRQHNIPIETPAYLPEVKNLVYDICPQLKGPILFAPYENSYKNIVEYAKKEDAILSFAHPVFTLRNMNKENVIDNIKNYIEKSEGRLLCSENYHQAYRAHGVSSEEINETNNIMNELKLIPIGGRDKHKNNFKF